MHVSQTKNIIPSNTPDEASYSVYRRNLQSFSPLHLLSSCLWGSRFYQLHLLFLLLMFFKHAQVHPSRGCSAGLVNLCSIPPHATQQHVIGDQVCFAAPLQHLSEYWDLCPGCHPHAWLTGPWRDASVGRQELLVQRLCTHHRSILPHTIRVAETDVLTGFSALPSLLTTVTPLASQKHTHAYLHTQSKYRQVGNLLVLPLKIQTNSTCSRLY